MALWDEYVHVGVVRQGTADDPVTDLAIVMGSGGRIFGKLTTAVAGPVLDDMRWHRFMQAVEDAVDRMLARAFLEDPHEAGGELALDFEDLDGDMEPFN